MLDRKGRFTIEELKSIYTSRIPSKEIVEKSYNTEFPVNLLSNDNQVKGKPIKTAKKGRSR